MKKLKTVIAGIYMIFLLSSSAWAGAGWYLMTPPVVEVQVQNMPGGYGVTMGVPFSEWRFVDSFDTAKECKAEIKEQRAWAEISIKEKKWFPPFNEFNEARCIASDDPRLQK